MLRLTNNIADYSPAWTPDGQHIAFLRDVGDHFSVRLVPSLGGVEREIHVGQRSQAGNWEPENAGLSFSPDGKFLAFSELNAGGREIALRTGPGPDLWSNWALSNNGVYFLIPGHPGPEIEFLDFRTKLVSRVGKLDKPSFCGLAISPNGKSLIFSQQDKSQHQIFVMSGFR